MRVALRAAYASGRHDVTIAKAIKAAADSRRGTRLPAAVGRKIADRQRGKALTVTHRDSIRRGVIAHLKQHPRVFSTTTKAAIGRRSRLVWAAMSQEQRDARRHSGRAAWARLSDEQRRARMVPAQNAAGRTRPTSLERTVAALLTALSVPYVFQHRIDRYLVDFYLPTYDLAIECDGEYWHRHSAERDRRRDERILATGCRVLRLPEQQIVNGQARQTLELLLRAAC